MTENALNAYAQAQGINATVNKMSEQEKVALRYNFVLQQLTLAQGDFAKTSDSWANQIRIMQLRFESFKATMGQGLINVFLPVIKVINAVIQRLQVFAAYFSAITGALFGKAQQGATNVSSSLGGSSNNSLSNSLNKVNDNAKKTSNSLKKATSATKKTGTAAKKAKKEIKGLISGFDEINNLNVSTTAGTKGTSGKTPSSGKISTPSTSGIGDLGLGDLANIPDIDLGNKIDTTGLEAKVEKVKETIEKFKKWLRANKDAIIAIVAGTVAGIMSYFVMSKWSSIAGAISKLLKPFKALAGAFKNFGIKGIIKSFTGLLGLNPIFLVIATVIGVVVGALVYLWRTNKDFRKNVIKTWKAIKEALAPWLEAFAEIFKLLGDILKTILVPAFKLWAKAVVKVVEFLVNKLLKKIQKYCPQIKSLGEAFLELVKKLSKVWKTTKDFCKKVSNMIKKIGLRKTIEVLMKKLINKIVEKVGEIKKKFNNKFKEVVDAIKDFVAEKWQDLIDSVKDFVINIVSKVEDFKEQVVEKWDEVKTWMSDKILNIVSKVEDFKEKVIEKWDIVKDSAKDFILNIASKVEDFKENISEKWKETKQWLKEKVLEIGFKINDFYKVVQDKFNEAKTWLKGKALEIGSKIESFYEKVRDSYNSAKEKIKEWAFSIGTKVSSIYEKVRDSYNSAKEKVKGWTFSVGTKVGSFYDKVKNAYNDAKSKIKSWAFSIALKVNTSANNVKNTINGIIKQINSAVMGKIKFTVPDWIPVFGGKTWKAPTIPYLAKGGIVDSATLAMIGEAGKEAVIPLENNTGGLDLLASKLHSRMSNGGIVSSFSNNSNSGVTRNDLENIGPFNFNISIGGQHLRNVTVDTLRQLKRQGITI